MLAAGIDDGATGVPEYAFYACLDGVVAVDPEALDFPGGVLSYILFTCHGCSISAVMAVVRENALRAEMRAKAEGKS